MGKLQDLQGQLHEEMPKAQKLYLSMEIISNRVLIASINTRNGLTFPEDEKSSIIDKIDEELKFLSEKFDTMLPVNKNWAREHLIIEYLLYLKAVTLYGIEFDGENLVASFDEIDCYFFEERRDLFKFSVIMKKLLEGKIDVSQKCYIYT